MPGWVLHALWGSGLQWVRDTTGSYGDQLRVQSPYLVSEASDATVPLWPGLQLVGTPERVFSWSPADRAPWPVLKDLRYDVILGQTFIRYYCTLLPRVFPPRLEVSVLNERFDRPLILDGTSRLRFAVAARGGVNPEPEAKVAPASEVTEADLDAELEAWMAQRRAWEAAVYSELKAQRARQLKRQERKARNRLRKQRKADEQWRSELAELRAEAELQALSLQIYL